ncbi:MAG: hypothetical protein ACE5IM_12250, partial [Nitrospinota bacterium]
HAELQLARERARYRELERSERAFRRLVPPGSTPETLLQTFEAALRALNLKGNLVSANPGQAPINSRYAESFLQVKLSGFRWEDVMRLLYKLEGEREGLWVKKARLVANEESRTLDGELSLSVFIRRGGNRKGK